MKYLAFPSHFPPQLTPPSFLPQRISTSPLASLARIVLKTWIWCILYYMYFVVVVVFLFLFVCFWSQFDTISNPEKLLALLFPLVLFINYLKARAKVILMGWINWSPVAGIMSPPKTTPLRLSSPAYHGCSLHRPNGNSPSWCSRCDVFGNRKLNACACGMYAPFFFPFS